MVTLKELVKDQDYTGGSDLGLIRSWFIMNGKESAGIEMITDLASAAIEKKDSDLRRVEWASMLPSKYLYETYSLDIADQLHSIELDYIVHGKVGEKKMRWAEENLPKIKEPQCYFRPCIEWLAENGVKFKNSTIK